VRFLLTFAQNTHRIKVFRLAKEPFFQSLADAGYESCRVRNESNLLLL